MTFGQDKRILPRRRAEEKGARNMAFKVFHESRVTKHESRPFIACFDRWVVRNAAW